MKIKLFKWYKRYFSIESKYERARKYWVRGGVYRYVAMYITFKIKTKYGCYLSPKAIIGKNLSLRHPVGVVIGDGVTIGDNATIYQGVTLGAARSGEGAKALYPNLSDEITIFAGACVLGNINISNNVIVGANSVLLVDATPDSVYAGIPAKRIK